jgi:hypothetical protein
MTGKQQIDYEALTQDALRGIVRAVLQSVATSGLPGDHHFFIAIDTGAPGVIVSRRLKERYPEEMTIVLQHQFSRLVVNDERFEVTLSFGNVPERLTVPLTAVRRFFDPSVRFIIHFEGSDLVGDDEVRELEPEPEGEETPDLGRRLGALRRADEDEAAGAEGPGRLEKVRSPRKPAALQGDASGEPAARPTDEASGPIGGQAARRQAARPKLVKSKPDAAANDSKVVDLDKFRKK